MEQPARPCRPVAAVTRYFYLQFQPADYLSDYKTARLSLEEHGAYHLLLWHMWNDSDEQCVFPLDYTALGGIWRCCPEEAERLCDSLIAPGMALFKVVARKKQPHLFCRRLFQERAAYEARSLQASAAGKVSGAVRSANAVNGRSTDVQRTLNGKRTETEQVRTRTRVIDKPPSLPSSTVRQPKERGVSRTDIQSVRDYFEDKAGRAPSVEEKAFITRAAKRYGVGEVKVHIGYAIEVGADSIPAYAMDGLQKGEQ